MFHPLGRVSSGSAAAAAAAAAYEYEYDDEYDDAYEDDPRSGRTASATSVHSLSAAMARGSLDSSLGASTRIEVSTPRDKASPP